jgi:hypothetical protein
MSDRNDENLPALPGAVLDENGRLEIGIRSGKLEARDIHLGGMLVIDELRLTGSGIVLTSGEGGGFRISELNATVIVTESALNNFLTGRSEDSLHHLKAYMLTGKVRFEGRYGLIPFTYTGVPEIEGGARLRLDPRQMSIIGLPLPGVGVQVIGERLNAQLAKAFDITRLPVQMRLTGLTIETGRLLLSATAAVEMSPSR